MAFVPRDDRAPHPEPRGLADGRVRDAVRQRIALASRARLEPRTRHIPLKEMDLPPGGLREVRELMDEQALAGTRKTGEEDHALNAQAANPLGQPAVGIDHQAR